MIIEKKHTFVLLTYLSVILLSLNNPLYSGIKALDFNTVDRYIEQFMRDQHIPGLAIAIVQGDQIVHARGFGFAGPTGRQVTAQTPFILGSTSKSFTALAVMQLVESGKINLDIPVSKYIPWLLFYHNRNKTEITTRQLLNHTSGIPNIAGEESLSINDTASDALERQVRGLTKYSLVYKPGTVCEYANANYQIAGLVVQIISGESFESYVQRNIFDRLEMRHSYISKSEAEKHGLATGYRYWFGFPVPTDAMPYPRQQFPAGYYICSAEDLAHAVIAHLNGGQYKDRSVLSAAGIEVLHQPALDNYAMGWGVNAGVLWHDGSVQDFGSQLVADPRHKLGIAIVFNVNNSHGAQHLYCLAPNLLYLLTGRQMFQVPPPNAYIRIIFILGFLLILLIIWIILTAIIIRKWRFNPSKRPQGNAAFWILVIPVLIQLATAWNLWQQMPKGIRNAMSFEPDITSLIIINMVLLISWSVIGGIIYIQLLLRRNTESGT